jgi:hypothetical protein
MWGQENQHDSHRRGWRFLQLQDTQRQEVQGQHKVHSGLQNGRHLRQDVVCLHQVQHQQQRQEEVQEGGSGHCHCQWKVKGVSI